MMIPRAPRIAPPPVTTQSITTPTAPDATALRYCVRSERMRLSFSFCSMAAKEGSGGSMSEWAYERELAEQNREGQQ